MSGSIFFMVSKAGGEKNTASLTLSADVPDEKLIRAVEEEGYKVLNVTR